MNIYNLTVKITLYKRVDVPCIPPLSPHHTLLLLLHTHRPEEGLITTKNTLVSSYYDSETGYMQTHTVKMSKRCRRLTAALLRVLGRGSNVLTCSANICRFWIALFRINKKASVRRRVAMTALFYLLLLLLFFESNQS